MADTKNPSTPASTPNPKHRQAPGDVDKHLLDNVALGRTVYTGTQDPVRAAKLLTRAVTAENLSGLDEQLKICEKTLIPDIITKKHNRLAATTAEAKALTVLNKALKVIFRGVDRTYPGDAAKHDSYLIGKMRTDRVGLQADVISVVNRGQADTLKGVTPADYQAVTDALQLWMDANTVQTTASDLWSSAVQALVDALGPINTTRRDIQFAGDILWPFDVATDHPHRLALVLPLHQPFVANRVSAPPA